MSNTFNSSVTFLRKPPRNSKVRKSRPVIKIANCDRGPQDALDDEWLALRDDDCWDGEDVIAIDDLIKTGEGFYGGYLFDICV